MSNKKTVLITGGAGGIGSELCREFALKGFNVAINYFTSSKQAAALKDDLVYGGCNAEIFRADISDCGKAKKMVAAVIKKFGAVDVLVNNAGISQTKLFTEISEAELEKMLAVNFCGAFFVTQEAVKDMLKRKSGKIINISSIWGKSGGSCETHYSASKAALDGLTKSLAKELGPSGITVNSIACGLIDTAMNNDLSADDKKSFVEKLPLGRIGTAKEVAVFAASLADCGSDYMTGQIISLDGGFLI